MKEGSGDLEGIEAGESSENSFHDDMRKVIREHFEEFPEGSVYYNMREEFDNAIVQESLNKVGRMKKASKRVGLSFKTFRKMFRGEREI